jgi:exodeoxyribonuclease-3
MKIATFNINDINERVANLLDWLEVARPDVACLQELKTAESEFPIAAIERAGYGAVWKGQKSWNGVAILARGSKPVITRASLPGDPADTQSRYIEAAVNGVLIGALYAPNGNPQPGPKIQIQARVDGTFDCARRRALSPRRAGRAGRRLQCGADRRGHLPDAII